MAQPRLLEADVMQRFVRGCAALRGLLGPVMQAENRGVGFGVRPCALQINDSLRFSHRKRDRFALGNNRATA